MELQFVAFKKPLYKQAVQVRIEAFFNEMPNALGLVNDPFENLKSHYLVILKEQKVIATGRLHIKDSVGVVSQMAVAKNYQKQGCGSKILNGLMQKAQDLNCTSVNLSARETAIPFYEKHGFVPFGEKYPSLKTGVVHIKMNKVLV